MESKLYYTTAEVMKLLQINRSRVSAIARARGWRSEEVPSRRNIKAKLYLAEDVKAEIKRRLEKKEQMS